MLVDRLAEPPVVGQGLYAAVCRRFLVPLELSRDFAALHLDPLHGERFADTTLIIVGIHHLLGDAIRFNLVRLRLVGVVNALSLIGEIDTLVKVTLEQVSLGERL